MNCNVIPLFPSFIQISNSDGKSYIVSEKEINFVNQLTYIRNHTNCISQSINILNEHPLQNIKKYIQQNLDNYIYNVLYLDKKIKCNVTTSWANKTKVGETHHTHNHGNSFLSGVMSFTKNNTLVFQDSEYMKRYFGMNFRFENAHMYEVVPFTTESIGSLVLFPSGLAHFVPPFEGPEERISISFNTMISGEIGKGVDSVLIK